jgi:excisionase family DNA binding protein
MLTQVEAIMEHQTEFLSVEQFAKAVGGISKWTVYAWLSKGIIRRTKVGRRTMIRVSEIERVAKDQ